MVVPRTLSLMVIFSKRGTYSHWCPFTLSTDAVWIDGNARINGTKLYGFDFSVNSRYFGCGQQAFEHPLSEAKPWK
jgi:hypothetical protein